MSTSTPTYANAQDVPETSRRTTWLWAGLVIVALFAYFAGVENFLA